MTKILTVLCVCFVIATAFVAGRVTSKKKPDAAAVPGRKILHYVDPMNPAHTTSEPGLAPCGMEMVPVYADDPGALPDSRKKDVPGTVKLSLQRQQLIGLITGSVEKKSFIHTLRLPGKVEANASRTYQVTAPAEGWITKTMPLTVGDAVQKDQTLALLYSPTFISAAQAFRNALNYQDRMLTNNTEPALQRPGLAEFNVKQYADSLRNLGVSERQINDMLNERKYSEHIEVVAPADGYLSVRNISEGQRFEKGQELYRVVDLSQVWVVADVFNRDAALISTNIEAKVFVPSSNTPLPARLTATLPQYDVASRSLKIRFEAGNPQLQLKPDMLVDVVVEVALPESLVVPGDAVLDSGLRQTVFIETGAGTFEPREIQTGWRFADSVQITKGLMEGEKIVTSGNFLLDSESRMKAAAARNESSAPESTSRGTNTVPSKVAMSETDPVCGMKVNMEKARAAGRFFEYEGKIYYFCAEGCKEEFKANPRQFLTQTASAQARHD